jgi:prepilin-type N-terminal cleavage/methylation domain-containing protein
MRKTKLNLQGGFSLLELIVVLTIIAIVSTIALTRFGRTDARFQRQNMARELKVYLERARYDSVKRRATQTADQAKVEIINSTTFRVTTDANINGTIDANDTRLYSFAGRSDVKIVGNALTLVFPITIRFDYRGQAEITNGNAAALTNPVFTVCDAGCTVATANANNSTIISITPTGTVIMANGGLNLTTINAPVVTTVNTNANINCLLKASGNVTCP